MTQRYIKICMVASIALFFSLVAIDNIIDFNANWLFVQHVLSMDTTFQDPILMRRAITDSTIQKYFYYLIIFWQFLTALLCWVGCLVLLSNRRATRAQFRKAKNTALMGLFFGFLLYMVGFIVIGGEWFSMWQSPEWNGQATAGLFISLIMFVMLFVNTHEIEEVE